MKSKQAILINLWIFNHPFVGISDQLEFLLNALKQNGYDVSVSRNPSLFRLNIVIENFSENSRRVVQDFCSSSGKRVAIVMTEHIDFIESKIFIHGSPLWTKNDYMHPDIQANRLKSLFACTPFISAFLVLGDMPELLGLENMFPGVGILSIPFPRIIKTLKFNNPDTDFIFSGCHTFYRSKMINLIKDNGFTIIANEHFSSRKVRNILGYRAKINLNIPQRSDWHWLSLMRILAALYIGRPTISLNTSDVSMISSGCIQLDTSSENWADKLRESLANSELIYEELLSNYVEMQNCQKLFPHDFFRYWSLLEL